MKSVTSYFIYLWRYNSVLELSNKNTHQSHTSNFQSKIISLFGLECSTGPKYELVNDFPCWHQACAPGLHWWQNHIPLILVYSWYQANHHFYLGIQMCKLHSWSECFWGQYLKCAFWRKTWMKKEELQFPWLSSVFSQHLTFMFS